MKTIQIFDPPMCCSSGVCGPDVNPELVTFAADLDWLKSNGIIVERFNLTSDPDIFTSTEVVNETLNNEGDSCLPLILVEGSIISKGNYPPRNELEQLVGMPASLTGEADTSEVTNQSQTMENEPCCEPECECHASSPNNKFKVAVGIFIFLLAATVFIYKIIYAKPVATTNKAAFSVGITADNDLLPQESKNKHIDSLEVTITPQNEEEVENKVNQESNQQDLELQEDVKPSSEVSSNNTGTLSSKSSEKDKTYIGDTLAALNILNMVAIDYNAVFIFMPEKSGKSITKNTVKALNSAQQDLKLKNIKTGLFTLDLKSRDYRNIEQKNPLPAVLVVSKGRGSKVVSGNITKSKLMQAFMASNHSSCCPPDSGKVCK